MIDRLERYVAMRSLSREEKALADLIQNEIVVTGLKVDRAGNNIWFEFGDAPRPRLLLNSHLDTVPASEGWTSDPWTPREKDGRVVGLGANDAKGCVVTMIEAALGVRRRMKSGQPMGGTLVVALTAEEEISGAGLGTVRDQLGAIDAAIVGEPTGLVPMAAQRGLLIVRGVARGRSAHPAHTPPSAAENAIQKAANDLLRLSEFDWGREHPLLGRCHAHVTQITGGVARNVIPDHCEFFLDIRTTPGETHAALFERLSRFLDCELAMHSDRLVPVETPKSQPIVRAVLKALPAVEPAGSPAMSDMVFLADVPCVKIGPGDPHRSHTPNEYITVDELTAGAAAYERIIQAYFDIARQPVDAKASQERIDA